MNPGVGVIVSITIMTLMAHKGKTTNGKGSIH